MGKIWHLGSHFSELLRVNFPREGEEFSEEAIQKKKKKKKNFPRKVYAAKCAALTLVNTILM